MRLLLDTHALLWAVSDPGKLSKTASSALKEPANEVAISAVSSWEIAIKQSLGKLGLPLPAETWLPKVAAATGFDLISVTPVEALRTRALPWHHKDPFDRLLIAQAMGGYRLVTHELKLAAYGVPTLW